MLFKILMLLNSKNIKKNAIVFRMEGILVPYPSGQKLDNKSMPFLEKLKELQDNNLLALFLVTGYHKKTAVEKIKEFSLEKYFLPENTFFVTNDYIGQKQEFDHKLHKEKLEQNKDYVDGFFKQKVLQDLVKEKGISKEKILFVGKDIFMDAFYTHRFSGVDFVLVKELLSYKNEPLEEQIKGLNYVSLEFDSFKPALLGKLPEQDFKFLEAKIFNELKKKLLKDQLNQIKMKMVEKKQKQ
jgi:hypothetical protein